MTAIGIASALFTAAGSRFESQGLRLKGTTSSPPPAAAISRPLRVLRSAFICIRVWRRSFARNTNAVTLTTPGGQIWRFLAEGAEIDVEESIFFADPICLKRSLQIVLKGPCTKATSVHWKFEKVTQQRPVLLGSNPRRAS